MRWHGRPLAARIDAALGVATAHPMLHPGVVLPRLGP
jgi:hypothetical protein